MCTRLVLVLTLTLVTVESAKQRLSCEMMTHNEGDVIGSVTLIEKARKNKTVLTFKVNLDDGNTGKITAGYHGLHVHANAVEGVDCTTAGGHYNPDGTDHGSLFGDEGANDKAARHSGDLGNFIAGHGQLRQSVRIRTGEDFPSPLGNFADLEGKAMVLHALEDDLGRAGDDGSAATGNAGGRVACCTLVGN